MRSTLTLAGALPFHEPAGRAATRHARITAEGRRGYLRTDVDPTRAATIRTRANKMFMQLVPLTIHRPSWSPRTPAGTEKANWVTLRSPAECVVSQNPRTRSQADTDSWHGLFDTQTGPRAGGSSLSKKRILLANLLQSSRSTFSWRSFLRFFAFKEGIVGHTNFGFGGWPTVSGRFLAPHAVVGLNPTRVLPAAQSFSVAGTGPSPCLCRMLGKRAYFFIAPQCCAAAPGPP